AARAVARSRRPAGVAGPCGGPPAPRRRPRGAGRRDVAGAGGFAVVARAAARGGGGQRPGPGADGQRWQPAVAPRALVGGPPPSRAGRALVSTRAAPRDPPDHAARRSPPAAERRRAGPAPGPPRRRPRRARR